MKPLRSALAPGSVGWAVRRAQWKAIGLSDEDFDKPKIAIVNTSSQLSVCFSHLDAIAERVRRAIADAGGVGFEIRTTAPSDFITCVGQKARYLLASRDLVVNDIEVQVEGALLDGMVLLSSCDKTTPAHLMAAGRLDLPSIVLPCGYQLGGACAGRSVDIEDLFKATIGVRTGTLTVAELGAMADHAICGPGVCAGMGTANSMHLLAEALGMALPGTTPIRAGSSRLDAVATQAGRRIVQLVREDLRPRLIMTAAAFENAVIVAIAAGASINCVRHLAAIATETGCAIDIVATIERASAAVPQLIAVRPNGEDRIEDLDAAGGCRALMRQLRPLLDPSTRNIAGCALAQVLDDTPAPAHGVIGTLQAPRRAEPGLAVLRGNLAPDGAVVKLSAFPPGLTHFAGPARVFDTQESALQALSKKAIVPGEVVILRMLGPRGGPGTVAAAGFVAALAGAGLSANVAVITDGELSGLNSGITVGQVMPEAAEGGPLVVVREGETIRIDLTGRRIDVDLPDHEIARRLAHWSPPARHGVGWLWQYHALVQPLSGGAVLGRRDPGDP